MHYGDVGRQHLYEFEAAVLVLFYDLDLADLLCDVLGKLFGHLASA